MKKLCKGFIMALSMFTVLPTPYVEWDDDGAKNMMKFYPLIGLIVGVIWSIICYLINMLDVSIVLKSVIIMIAPFCVTGMLHLDGFMDVCDAILSRRSREEKLRILKDSTTGAFAVIALVILFFLQFGGIYSIIEKKVTFYIIIIIIPIVSRSAVAYFLLSRTTIKESTLGAYFKKGTNAQDKIIMIVSLLIMLIAAFFSLSYYGVITVLLIILGITWAVERCKKEFGGISGDVAGFALVVGEVIGILTFSIMP